MAASWPTDQADADYARFPYKSRRSVVWSSKGMVACSQPLAAEAGLEILRKGGNAADAAVATAAALNVTEPGCCGIGGDMFCLFYNAKDQSIKGVNGSGRAPAALSLDRLRELGVQGSKIPLISPHAVTVPGAISGFCETLDSFGSNALTRDEVFAPAIRLAEEGFPVSEISSWMWKKSEKLIQSQSPNGGEMLIDGKAPEPGQIFANPTLAQTFRSVAKHGSKGFYEGPVAEAIVQVLKDKGGLMELEDLKLHVSERVDPISYTYQNEYTLHECPPNGQGLTALIALGIIEQMERLGKIDFEKAQHNGVEYTHALIEALRLAFADTRAYLADMQHGHVPVKELLSEEYLRGRAQLFDTAKATANVKEGRPISTSDTVYLTTADKDGNACSFIFSNFAGFGTAIIPKGCGFTLQNRGNGFTLEDGHPNNIAPKKRPYHTIIPAMVTRGKELFMAYGVMGGFMQPQGHVQVLLNMLHQIHQPQNALDAPRICISAGLEDPSAKNSNKAGDMDSEVNFEEGFDPAVVDTLKKMGHNAKLVTGAQRAMFGRGQIIKYKQDTRTGQCVWSGGSDPRADGHVVAQI